ATCNQDLHFEGIGTRAPGESMNTLPGGMEYAYVLDVMPFKLTGIGSPLEEKISILPLAVLSVRFERIKAVAHPPCMTNCGNTTVFSSVVSGVLSALMGNARIRPVKAPAKTENLDSLLI